MSKVKTKKSQYYVVKRDNNSFEVLDSLLQYVLNKLHLTKALVIIKNLWKNAVENAYGYTGLLYLEQFLKNLIKFFDELIHYIKKNIFYFL